jgi:hypothetical protein
MIVSSEFCESMIWNPMVRISGLNCYYIPRCSVHICVVYFPPKSVSEIYNLFFQRLTGECNKLCLETLIFHLPNIPNMNHHEPQNVGEINVPERLQNYHRWTAISGYRCDRWKHPHGRFYNRRQFTAGEYWIMDRTFKTVPISSIKCTPSIQR